MEQLGPGVITQYAATGHQTAPRLLSKILNQLLPLDQVSCLRPPTDLSSTTSAYLHRIGYLSGQNESLPRPSTQDLSQTTIEESEHLSSLDQQFHEEILTSVHETEMTSGVS